MGYPRKKPSFSLQKDGFFLGYPKCFWPFLFWSGFSIKVLTCVWTTQNCALIFLVVKIGIKSVKKISSGVSRQIMKIYKLKIFKLWFSLFYGILIIHCRMPKIFKGNPVENWILGRKMAQLSSSRPFSLSTWPFLLSSQWEMVFPVE